MNVDLGIWDGLRRMVVWLLFAAGVLAVLVWYLPVIQYNERLRHRLMRLEAQVRQEEEKGRQIQAMIRALQYDPRAVERLAREKLGYVKPGETRIQFVQPESPAAR